MTSKSAQTLIGLAAGYVDGDMSGVKLDGKLTLDVDGQTSTAITSITDNLSDYGLVGYTTKTGSGGSYSQKLSSYFNNEENTGPGDEDDWGGSFNSKDYTLWFYDSCSPITTSSTDPNTKVVTGDGGYDLKFTASRITDPRNDQGIYRLRDGAYIPLKFEDNTKSKASLSNTGYLVGSNILDPRYGDVGNASPKVASYRLVNIGNALSNTPYTNLKDTYNASTNIQYESSKLEVLTYNNGWFRIVDSYNETNATNNTQIRNYTRKTVDELNLKKYNDSRETIEASLLNSEFIYGIHFDNNAVGVNNLLTIPANTARIGGAAVGTTYQVPKGSINFNLKEKGIINFFAGTYNTNDVNLNFFSLHQVFRNGSNITDIKEINQIYQNTETGGNSYVYRYSDNTYSAGTAGGLVFDVRNVLEANAPVKNMLYYFEIPVNAGEYAMGVAGTTQGAYMIYLDLAANADLIDTDKVTAYSILTTRSGAPFPAGVDFLVTDAGNNGGESIGVVIASPSKGTIVFDITRGTSSDTIAVSSVSGTTQIGGYSYRSERVGDNITVTGLSGDPPDLSPSGERILSIHLIKLDASVYDIRVTDQLDSEGVITSSIYEVDSGSGFEPSTYEAIVMLSEEINITLPSDATNYPKSLRNLEIAAILTRSDGTGEFATTYDTENCSCRDKIVDVDIEKNGATIAITVTEGYTFLIGGVAKVTGDTY